MRDTSALLLNTIRKVEDWTRSPAEKSSGAFAELAGTASDPSLTESGTANTQVSVQQRGNHGFGAFETWPSRSPTMPSRSMVRQIDRIENEFGNEPDREETSPDDAKGGIGVW